MPDQVEENEAAPAQTKKPGKRKMLIIGGAGAALLIAGGGAYAMMGEGGSETAETEVASDAGSHGPADGAAANTYVEVPPMVVNLRSADGQPRFLKLRFMFVPGKGKSEKDITDKIPFILDAYQPLLRELRPEDLSGSAAVFRLKEEMLVRAVEAGGEGLIADVLIQDLIQQ